MTDFVVLAVAVAAPPAAPTVGFSVYRDLAACERATTHLVARAGSRLACVPVESPAGEMATAY